MKVPVIYPRESYFTHGQSKTTGRRFTICATIRNGKTWIGIAECSKKDDFSRAIGRKISEKRAIHNPTSSYETTDKKEIITMLHIIKEQYEYPD